MLILSNFAAATANQNSGQWGGRRNRKRHVLIRSVQLGLLEIDLQRKTFLGFLKDAMVWAMRPEALGKLEVCMYLDPADPKCKPMNRSSNHARCHAATEARSSGFVCTKSDAVLDAGSASLRLGLDGKPVSSRQ